MPQPITIENDELRFNATRIFKQNLAALDSNKKIIVNQGASRSSKTISLWQIYFQIAYQNYFNNIKEVFSVVRSTMPSMRASVMRDFFKILGDLNLYDERLHSKSNNTYELFGNLIEFFSVNDFNKVKSRQRDWLWINEGDEISHEVFTQLEIRTSKKVFIDFNPSNPYSYIFENLESSDDAIFIKSTIFDNPFAPEGQKKSILNLKDVDPDKWKIYGLGEKAFISDLIYKNWIIGDFDNYNNDVFYGLDFGFNHPTVLTESYFKDDVIYTRESIYQSKLTNNELIDLLKLHVKKNCYIWADAAEPARIEEIKRAGFNVHSADKSVKDGIDFCKRYKIVIDRNSVNAIKEFKNYSYKKVNGVLVDEPVKFMDDFCLVGETLIKTFNGDVPIKDIEVGDYVLTRKGFKKVLAKELTGIKEVFEYNLQGNNLIATNNHKIIDVNNKKIMLLDLIVSDILVIFALSDYYKYKKVFLCQNLLYSMGLNTIDKITGNTTFAIRTILKMVSTHFIEMFGNSTTARYLKDIIFTTKTTILITMIFQILSASVLEIICNIICETKMRFGELIIKSTFSMYRNSLKFGTVLKRVKNGMTNTTGIVWLKHSLAKILRAFIVEKNIIQQRQGIVIQSNIAQMFANQHIGERVGLIILRKIADYVANNSKPINTQKQNTVQYHVGEKIIGLSKGMQPVYNLTIEDEHEYYANNVLVANCDSFRYGVFNYGKMFIKRDNNLIFKW